MLFQWFFDTSIVNVLSEIWRQGIPHMTAAKCPRWQFSGEAQILLVWIKCPVKAKFHYTDPTRTRPDPHGPLGPCESGRVRVVEFSYKGINASIRSERRRSISNATSHASPAPRLASPHLTLQQTEPGGSLSVPRHELYGKPPTTKQTALDMHRVTVKFHTYG